ncbi:MAG: Rieske (2Fe-2S) protein [Chloroflexi bacterium]|nr:Rieske (2Fe-2S) protein [Chloroflexota bacterium]
MAVEQREGLICAGPLSEIQAKGCVVVSGQRHGIAVFYHEGHVYAVDNRCPHMGFPLSKGTLHQGVLTCHWHHARFDLTSGGTFDPFADDVQVYPVHIDNGKVWIDPRISAADRTARSYRRLQDGLEQNLGLVIVKSVLTLREAGEPYARILAAGARFGTRYRAAGWGPGLTILTALGNLVPQLGPEEQVLALYHGLVHVAEDCAGQPPRFARDPLPTRAVSPERLKEWLRQLVEVRDVEGTERVLRTAIANGCPPARVADMLLAAATDHYFLNGGHTIDFLNKAFELLERSGWDQAEEILPGLVPALCRAQRSEESNAWRHPIDLVALLEPVLADLPSLLRERRTSSSWNGFQPLTSILLGDDPKAIVDGLVAALRDGAPLTALSGAVAYAAAVRIARFHTSNEFGDWITVLHTFSYANALHQCLKRAPSPEAARGIFHGAMRLYLDRFLNIPPARIPEGNVQPDGISAEALLNEFLDLLDREQQVNAAGSLVHRYLAAGCDDTLLIQTLGKALLREDAEFHTYQMLEAGIQQYHELKTAHPREARHVLIAVARYLAAHSPTPRSLLQTARIAIRLHRGEDLTQPDDET